MRFEAPTDRPVVLVAAAGRAEGSRAAAAALACAGADSGRASLMVELGGRVPRPTLVASEDARGLEGRLAGHLPGARVAARGEVCWLGAPADADGITAASAAVTVARGSLAVVHVPPSLVQEVLGGVGGGLRFSAALLRADLGADRALVALAAQDLLGRDLRLAILKRPLGWVAARRALFGVLGADSPGSLPPRTRRLLGLSGDCYGADNGFRAQ